MQLKFSLPVSVLKEGKYYVAYTPALDLSTSGKSLKEAKDRFGEAVGIFFEELLEKGTVDKVLSQLGWEKMNKEWAPPKVVFNESQSFSIPVPSLHASSYAS